VSDKLDTLDTDIEVSQHPAPNLSTISKSEVRKSRGSYRKRALPVEEIARLHDEGFGSKVIASRLQTEGIEVSYRTVLRILNGEREWSKGISG